MNPLSISQQKTEEALRHLESQGFEVKQLWRELTARGEARADEAPPEEDRVHLLPSEAPKTESHFVDGEPEVLQISKLWEGYSYTLTHGQKELLLEWYGMVPSRTVTVTWIDKWKGTEYPRHLRITSDNHVDAKLRRNLPMSAVIKTVGKFFYEANAKDAERAKEKRFSFNNSTIEIGRLFTLESEERWAVEDLSGVKVGKRVEVTQVSPEKFTVQCEKSGNLATLSRKAYFEIVDEYFTAYKEDRKTVGKKTRAPRFDPPSALDDLVKGLLASANQTQTK